MLRRRRRRADHKIFVRACAVEVHLNMPQEPLYMEIYKKTAADQNLGPHFVQSCAVEMHCNVSQEPLYAEIVRKNAAPIP